MYNDLNKILIVTNIYHKKYKIIFDNKKQEIIVNDEFTYYPDNFERYISDLIRIIRTWSMNQNCIEYETVIEITEKDSTYTYYIDNNLPDNYDSFIDLLIQLI